MPRCELDHIVIAARSLEDGAAYLEEMLGVSIPAGGEHPLMGTHNCLMRLGSSAFLEIIAIDRQAPEPARPRWFNLDDAQVQARIAQRPRLHTWVVRTDDIVAAAAASLISPVPLKRDGAGSGYGTSPFLRTVPCRRTGCFPR